MVNHLLDSFKGEKIKIITRYNLNEYRKGVSRLSAINRLLQNGAEVKGVKGLHSKLYIFDQKSVIITSANFTNGGFFNNKEFGIISDKKNTIEESQSYFQDLWKIDSELLNQSKVSEWKDIIAASKPISKQRDTLPDFGTSFQKSIIGKRRYFIKFFGKDDARFSLEDNVLNTLDDGCSHFALSFSRHKRDARPRRYRNGDIVFMAYITKEPNDYVIFGKAETFSHNDIRDVASSEDIENISWLKDWPILVRVINPKYIDSSLSKCPKLSDLMSELSYDSFASTKKKYDNDVRNIKPKNTLMQKGDVILSDSGAQWMERAFERVIKKEGKVNDVFVKSLYQSLKVDKL